MKLLPHIKPEAWTRRAAIAGFTMSEMMITMGIFTVIIGAMVGVQLFGLRVYTLAATKLTATTDGRETLNKIRDAIRSSKTIEVGTYSSGTFTSISNGFPQVGNCIRIYSSTNLFTTNFLVIYQDPASNMVFSKIGSSGTTEVLAKYMTNYYCFWSEDCYGNTVTTNQNDLVIRMQMNFFQWEYPIGFVGTNAANAYDYYFLRTTISRRCKT